MVDNLNSPPLYPPYVEYYLINDKVLPENSYVLVEWYHFQIIVPNLTWYQNYVKYLPLILKYIMQPPAPTLLKKKKKVMRDTLQWICDTYS